MAKRIEQTPVAYPFSFVVARPEDRGALYHAVELTIAEAGSVSGRVLQAFDRPGRSRLSFRD